MRQIMIGGVVRELAPVTYGMMKELLRHLTAEQGAAVAERGRLAGLPPAEINAELRELTVAEDAQEAVPYLLWLRTRAAGLTLEEIYALPLEELNGLAAEIMDGA